MAKQDIRLYHPTKVSSGDRLIEEPTTIPGAAIQTDSVTTSENSPIVSTAGPRGGRAKHVTVVVS
jgi:hypothetical protein